MTSTLESTILPDLRHISTTFSPRLPHFCATFAPLLRHVGPKTYQRADKGLEETFVQRNPSELRSPFVPLPSIWRKHRPNLHLRECWIDLKWINFLVMYGMIISSFFYVCGSKSVMKNRSFVRNEFFFWDGLICMHASFGSPPREIRGPLRVEWCIFERLKHQGQW